MSTPTVLNDAFAGSDLGRWVKERCEALLAPETELIQQSIDASYSDEVHQALQEPQYIIDMFATKQSRGVFGLEAEGEVFHVELPVDPPRYLMLSLPHTPLLAAEASNAALDLVRTAAKAANGDKECALRLKLMSAPISDLV